MVISGARRQLVVLFILLVGIFCSGKESFFDRQLDGEIALLRRDLDRPDAFLHLYSIWDLADFARWDGRIPDTLADILASPKASPLLKGYSLWFLREVDLRRGDFEAVRQKQAQLGFLVNWLIIGPFDNEGMAGFDLAYPPEEEINLGQTYSGKERPVAWRDYPQVSFDCYIDLSAALRPSSKTVAYALACVFSSERQPVAVRLGSDDCAKVWVGGELVHANRDNHPIGFDQSVVTATLEKGWNKILVKVCQDEEAWGFRLRLTAPNGGPLSFLRHAVGKDEVVAALQELIREQDKDSAVVAAEAADPIAEFKRLAEAHPDEAQYHAALSFLYWHARAFDSKTRADVRELEAAIALAPQMWEYHFRLGELHEDENKKRAAYERAAELNPGCAPALCRLGQHYATRNLGRKSVQYYLEAVGKDPSYYPAVLGVAEYFARNSLKPKAAKLLRDLLSAYPDTPYVLSYAVGFIPFPTGPIDSQERCENALRFNFCDRRLRDALLSNCHARHDLAGALRQLTLIERINPTDISVLLEHARLLQNNGRDDEAMVFIDRALHICPEDDLALRRKGELLLRRGSSEEAMTWLQRSFEVKPQNRPLREYIEFLKPRERPFEGDYKVDASQVIRDAPAKAAEEGDSAVYLYDLWVREVHPNGLSNSYHQEIVRILSEAGVEDFRARQVVCRRGIDEIQVKAARVFKKDGRVISADGPFSYPIGGEDRIYYDLQLEQVRFPSLEPGDAVEFAYRANAVSPSNMYGDYFGDMVYFKDKVPKNRMKYVVIAPTGKSLYYNAVEMSADPVVQARSDATVYIWEVKDIPKIESEPYMPGYSEILPYVHVSTYKDWETVGDWYWNLIRDQFLLDSSGKAEVARITRGLETEQEKIVAVHNYVVQNTRYIGLEFGIHSHKPYAAYKVYARRYGDCKDKAGLMMAMLREIGVDACMAALRTKSRGRVEPQPASLAVFNHAICYVPKYDMWLDGTAEYSGSRELPYEDQGTDALVVGNGIRKFVTSPVFGSERNLMSDVYQAAILPDGGIEFKLTGEVVGQYASYFRQMYQEEKDRQNALTQGWGRVLPNIRISQIQFDNLKQLEEPVRYSFEAFAPNYVVADESGGVGFPGLIQKLHLTRRYASLSKRRCDLVFDFPWSLRASVLFRLPSGYRVVSLPDDVHLSTGFGKCDIEFASTSQTSVTVDFRFSFDVTRVKAEQYEGFRDFCRLVDEKQTEKIRIAK